MNIISHVLNFSERGAYQLIANAKPEWFSTISSLFESHVMRNQNTDWHAAQHCRTTGVIFSLVNVPWVALETYNISILVSELKFLSVILGDSAQPRAFIATLAGLTAGAIFMSEYFGKHPPVSEDLKKEIGIDGKNGATLSWNSPLSQSIAAFVQAMRIVANVGLILFSPTSKLSAVINLLSLSYSYKKLTQMKWMELKQVFRANWPVNNNPVVQRITFCYNFLIFNPKSTNNPIEVKQNDICSICIGEIDHTNNADNTFSCTWHIYHIPCLVGHLYTKIKEFVNDLHFISVADYYKKGNYDYRGYKLSMSQNYLPKCPNCNEFPQHAKISVFIRDSERGSNCRVSLVLTNESEKVQELWFGTKTYQRATAIYDAFKATLSVIQPNHFDLTDRLLFINRVCLITDLGLLASEAYALYNAVKERSLDLKADPTQQTEASKRHFNKSIRAAFVIGCAAVLTTICLNRLFMPTINAKDLLVNALKMSPKQAANINLQWDKDYSEHLAQWILACRIFINTAAIAITKKTYEKVASLVLQAFTLYKYSNFYSLFVDLTHTTLPDGIAKISSKFQFVTNPATSLKDQLVYIYDYMTSMYKGSSWSGHKDKHDHLTWFVKVLSKRPQAMDINLPFLDFAGAYAISSWIKEYGRLSITFAS